jgi:phospholipid/cholesterol/gamma-HCH transport system substrate-binding protein
VSTRVLSRLVTFGLILAVIGVVVVLLWGKVGRRQVGQGFQTHVMLRDASALPIGSRVMIAGVQVGEISRLAIQGDLARVDMVLRDDVVLWDDASAEKRSASLFGDAYIELRPGGPELGAPSAGGGHRTLVRGERIPHAIEAASTDRVLRTVDRAMPRVQQVLDGANVVLRSSRGWVGGPARKRLEEIDRWLASDAATGPLTTANDAMTRLETWTTDLAETTRGAAPDVNRRLDTFAADVGALTADMRTARSDVSTALGDARRSLDVVDGWADDADELLYQWGAGPNRAAHADPGTPRPVDPRTGRPLPERNQVGTLVADGELGARIDELTDDGAGFAAGLARLKTWVGLRSEYQLTSAATRFYVTAEIYGRSDNFYLVELVKGSEGVPQVELGDSVGSETHVRTALIEEELRFTAQWGKRRGPMQFRFGIKESSVGAGVDAILMGGRLRFETDLFELTGVRVPRLKVAAALKVFESVYIIGGIDDALLEGGEVPVAPWPDGNDVPIQFEKVPFGRDFFLGVNLRFDERDVNSLLLLYGAVLAAVL